MEIWKPIPGFSAYEASSLGRIKRTAPAKTRTTPHILTGSPDGLGYCRVKIYNDAGKKVDAKVHRLVLLAHLGDPPPSAKHGCHNNGNPSDNRLENLRWDTPAGNLNDRKAHGTNPTGARNGRAKLSAEQVNQIRQSFTGAHGEVAKLAREYHMSHSQMWEVCHGSSW